MDFNQLVSRSQAARTWGTVLRERVRLIASPEEALRVEHELDKLVVRTWRSSSKRNGAARDARQRVARADALTLRADGAPAAVAAQLFARAAAMLVGVDGARCESTLVRAFILDPLNEDVASKLEAVLGTEGRLDELQRLQDCALADADAARRCRAQYAERFGLRWIYRLSQVGRAIRYLERALAMDPSCEPARVVPGPALAHRRGS